ncbi:hypothetical protein CAAN3_19S01662 [[Candida] anglica]
MKLVQQRLSLLSHRLSQILHGKKQESEYSFRECIDLLAQLYENFTKENLDHVSDSFIQVVKKCPKINKHNEQYINVKLDEYHLELGSLDQLIRRKKKRSKLINKSQGFFKKITNDILNLSNMGHMIQSRDQNEENKVQSAQNLQQGEMNRIQSIHNKNQIIDNTRQRIENQNRIRSLKEQIKTYDSQIHDGKRLVGEMIKILLELYLSIDEDEYEANFHHTIPIEKFRDLANIYVSH